MRSSGGPIEHVEEEEARPATGEFKRRGDRVGINPHTGFGNLLSDRDHTPALLIGNHRRGLDLDEPTRVDQFGDGDRRVGGANIAEGLSVRAPDFLEVARVDKVDARSHDVLEGGTGFRERLRDDLEATFRLSVGVGRRIGTVGHDRSGSGDPDLVSNHDRT